VPSFHIRANASCESHSRPRSSSRRLLYAFYSWCADAQIPELTTLAETIETWWPSIEVFLTTGLTNARTEGTNRLIKQVKRAVCGFRNRENTGAGYGCTAPGTPADCQRGNRVLRSKPGTAGPDPCQWLIFADSSVVEQ
jgi:hypothetical protein